MFSIVSWFMLITAESDYVVVVCIIDSVALIPGISVTPNLSLTIKILSNAISATRYVIMPDA